MSCWFTWEYRHVALSAPVSDTMRDMLGDSVVMSEVGQLLMDTLVWEPVVPGKSELRRHLGDYLQRLFE